jgi:hypothetical protein
MQSQEKGSLCVQVEWIWSVLQYGAMQRSFVRGRTDENTAGFEWVRQIFDSQDECSNP